MSPPHTSSPHSLLPSSLVLERTFVFIWREKKVRVKWNQSGQRCEGAECSLWLTVHLQCVPATLGAATHTHWQVGKWAWVKLKGNGFGWCACRKLPGKLLQGRC